MDISSNAGWSDPGPAPWDEAECAAGLAWTDECVLGQVPPDRVGRVEVAGLVHDGDVGLAGEVTRQVRALTAQQYELFARVLAEAAACPEVWCGPDPTASPDWSDPRARSARAVRAEREEMAVRAAVCDLAVRTRLSEQAVRARAADAQTLTQRCPQVWDRFRAGLVDERNAATVAAEARSLPEQPGCWAVYQAGVVKAAQTLPPGRFRTRSRAVRERAHPEPGTLRHQRARTGRAVWIGAEHDGMATLSVHAPAVDLVGVHRRLDQIARHLHAQPDEERTLAQLRTDAAIDLLGHAHTTTTSQVPGGKVAIAITVPALRLLDEDTTTPGQEHAILEDYGPIDIDTARRLAGRADSWVRILTHPLNGTILDLDRTTYRIPQALRRWLGAHDPVCTFPGCGRPARDCDIDHRTEWQHGGTTTATNTGPLCNPHHRIKTETLWQPHPHPDPHNRTTHWQSPTGHTTDTDPPPW